MPPMQQHQQLDFATATMKRPKPIPYKRFKLASPDKPLDDTNKAADDENINLDITSERNCDEDSLSLQSERKATKLICVGSPVPDSYIKSKPPLEKWSENNTMAELIYFENLPNYTGVFEKMTTVLRNVRNRLFNKPEESSKSANSTEQPNISDCGNTSNTSADDSEIQILN